MLAGFSARARPARSAFGRAGIGPKTVTRYGDARPWAWVERTGPHPVTIRALLTGKKGEGLRITRRHGRQRQGLPTAAGRAWGRKKKGARPTPECDGCWPGRG
ncbi:hypothetical protein Mkiyose1665_50650 [Mycobacterium kiyosense]|nr:hypothetical protein MKCMC460_60940 [Mycobacterium sp. 20KCMC460]GLB92985.1 hypothetical protein SRL2020130_58020 [Mycobacterium kiyosense]GLC04402.1 hypothetical protein SRL2020400_49930 [Mycobacterium kiyosense]GLC11164.1 hypothetical protein SRL2020411_58100 [Mycobacterium kiyosense]GLC17128.1 hypothetical protein SRL2020448_57310 [Mycobacterium kiyosense]